MRLKIVSDGTREGTKVVNAETGEEVENVVAVRWEGDARNPDTYAQISLMKIQAEFLGWAAK